MACKSDRHAVRRLDADRIKRGDKVKIKVIKRYYDIVLKEIIEQGTVRDVEEERARHLISEGVAEEKKVNLKKNGKDE